MKRCRSAFKLLEIDQKTKFLAPGQVILDCGAAPGSWTQIAVQKSNANGKISNLPKGFVVGIDLLQIYPIKVIFTHKNMLYYPYQNLIHYTGRSPTRQHKLHTRRVPGQNSHTSCRSSRGLCFIRYGTECNGRPNSRPGKHHKSLLFSDAIRCAHVVTECQSAGQGVGQRKYTTNGERYVEVL